MERRFIVAMRAIGVPLFKDPLEVTGFGTATGPANLNFSVRKYHNSDGIARNGDIWIHGEANGEDMLRVAQALAGASDVILSVISTLANASIEPVQVEIVYDATPGISEREFLQSVIPDEFNSRRLARPIDTAYAISSIRSAATHPQGERLQRACAQYSEALRNWEPGREIMAFAHLWMAVECLTKALLRCELAKRECSEDELCAQWEIDKKQLDATVRLKLIFLEDKECYDAARNASDGFEHGFDAFDKILVRAKKWRDQTAQYVRNAIVVEAATQDSLYWLSTDFSKPLAQWAITRYIKGLLIGDGELLAEEGNEYPILAVERSVSGYLPFSSGGHEIMFEEQLTPRIASGIGFKPTRFEVWGPTDPTAPDINFSIPKE